MAARKKGRPMEADDTATRYVGGAMLNVIHETAGDYLSRQRLIERIEAIRKRRMVTYAVAWAHDRLQAG